MNENQFNTWVDYFRTSFPSKAAWLMNSEKPGETVKHWYKVLRTIELDEATEVVDMMLADEDKLPKSWDHIPASVKSLSEKIRIRRKWKAMPIRDPNKYDPNECTRCRNGMVTCYQSFTVAGALGQKMHNRIPTRYNKAIRIHEVDLPCPHCDLGREAHMVLCDTVKKRRGSNANEPPFYDENKWCVVDGAAMTEDKHVESIKAWYECRTPLNYNHELAEWSNEQAQS